MMNTREVVRLVVGSVAVYVIVAACSANERIVPPAVKNGTTATGGMTNANGGTNTNGGISAKSGSSAISTGGSLLTAITNPVSDAAAQAATSGSRLKANYYVGTDGSKEFIGWHDSQLGVDCSFVLASDGTTRCMPLGTPSAVAIINVAFSDSACSQPVAQVNKGCSAPKYGYSGGTSVCDRSYVIYQLGSAYTATIYSGSSCVVNTG